MKRLAISIDRGNHNVGCAIRPYAPLGTLHTTHAHTHTQTHHSRHTCALTHAHTHTCMYAHTRAHTHTWVETSSTGPLLSASAPVRSELGSLLWQAVSRAYELLLHSKLIAQRPTNFDLARRDIEVPSFSRLPLLHLPLAEFNEGLLNKMHCPAFIRPLYCYLQTCELGNVSFSEVKMSHLFQAQSLFPLF